MTPAPEVKIMRTPDGETVEVMKVGGKWVERVEGEQHASAPVVDGRRDISEQVNAQAGAPAPAPKPQPKPESSIWSALASNARDMGRGLGQGFTFSRGDEAAANVAELASVQAPGDASPRSTTMNASNRVAGRGLHAPAMSQQQVTDAVYTDLRDSERQGNAAAEQRSPWLYGGGRALGMTPAAIGVGGTVAGGAAPAGLVPAAEVAAAEGAVLGGIDASGADTDKSGAQRRADALMGAGGGAMGGIAGAGVGAAGGAALRKGAQAGADVWGALADKTQRAGWRNRAAASGVYGGEMGRMVKAEGRDLPERMGQAIEAAGAHKRPESSSLPSWVPQSAGVYADTLETATKSAGQKIGAPVDAATARGATVAPDEIAAALAEARAARAAANLPSEDAAARELDDIARRMGERSDGRNGQPYTPRELWDMRHAMKGEASLDPQALVTPEATARSGAYRQARDVLRDKLKGQMTPEEAAQFDAANDQYGLLQKAKTASQNREARELGNQLASFTSPGAAAAGALMGGAPGAALGVLGAETTKRVGRDALADTLGGTATAMRGAARASQAVADALPAPATAGAAAGTPGSVWGALAGHRQPAAADSEARGQKLESAARHALRSAPQLLGPYRDRFAEAEATGDPVATAQLIDELNETDPDWRKSVAPKLQAAAAGAQLPR